MAFAGIRKEIPRTLIHVLGGVFLACVGYLPAKPLNLILLGLLLFLVLVMETGRMAVPGFNRFARKLLGPFMRPNEERFLTGAPAFFGGVFLSFLLFSKTVALAAMVPLLFGDRAGLLLGKGFGKIRIGTKTLEGSLACFTASLLAFLLLSATWPDVFGYVPAVLAGASVVGTLAEALPRPFDDNLTIPLAVGTFLSLIA